MQYIIIFSGILSIGSTEFLESSCTVDGCHVLPQFFQLIIFPPFHLSTLQIINICFRTCTFAVQKSAQIIYLLYLPIVIMNEYCIETVKNTPTKQFDTVLCKLFHRNRRIITLSCFCHLKILLRFQDEHYFCLIYSEIRIFFDELGPQHKLFESFINFKMS